MPSPALLPLVLACWPQTPVLDMVEVRVADRRELARLHRFASDVDDHGVVADTARVFADDLEQIHLRSLGFELEVRVEDLAAFYSSRAAEDYSGGAVGSMGGFRTLAEIEAEMDRLATDFAGLVSPRWSIGTSHQGREIWAMRVSDNPGVDEPAEPVAWFDALHHAREPMSGESLLQLTSWLCEGYGVEGNATRVLNTRSLVLVPCVNPDGYEYNRQTNPNGGGMWRKNRRDNGGGSFGVDLNRNYSFEWGPGSPGSSGNPDSETYRGPAPFSEPECQAVRAGFLARIPATVVSAHTFSDLWLYPWGYDTPDPPDIALYGELGEQATAVNGWVHGPASQVLYIANGVSIDWTYGQHGAISFTPEIGGDADGFWPQPARISALFEDVRPGYLQTALAAGAWVESVWVSQAEVAGDGDEHVEAGETWDLILTLANRGLALAAGTAHLSSGAPEIAVVIADAPFYVAPGAQEEVGPLRLTVAAGAPAGAFSLDVGLTWEGETTVEPYSLIVGQPRLLAHDAMESDDFGWTVSDASHYSWERADPQQTTSLGQTVQPGVDNPAGSGSLCWGTGAAAGAGAGTNDVDGTTALTSPRFRAAAFGHVELEYARWFANLPGSALDDVLAVEVSSDGGASWAPVESTANDNQWRTVSFALEDHTALTDEMRLRFTVADEPNNDLTEGLLDDLRLWTTSTLPTFGLWGATALGEDQRMFLDGPPGVSYRIQWSLTAGTGMPVPGVDGRFYLTGNVRTLRTGLSAGTGLTELPLRIPPNPILSGLTVHLQVLFDEGGGQAAFSNLLTFTIE
ncbi:MAG: hypothetical protein CMJ84_10550 [Planctomycetes bacterium]|nr:hypothetical protein [Planctomycetota bacterium]